MTQHPRGLILKRKWGGKGSAQEFYLIVLPGTKQSLLSDGNLFPQIGSGRNPQMASYQPGWLSGGHGIAGAYEGWSGAALCLLTLSPC